MRQQVYEIDKNGFIVEIYVEDFNEDGTPINELSENLIMTQPQHGLHRARWTGTEWVEDKSKEEFEYDEMISSLNPSIENIENAEFEIRVLNTLMEVGLV